MSTPEQVATHDANIKHALADGLSLQHLLLGTKSAKEQLYREAAMLFAGGSYPETYVLMAAQLDTLQSVIEARLSGT